MLRNPPSSPASRSRPTGVDISQQRIRGSFLRRIPIDRVLPIGGKRVLQEKLPGFFVDLLRAASVVMGLAGHLDVLDGETPGLQCVASRPDIVEREEPVLSADDEQV